MKSKHFATVALTILIVGSCGIKPLRYYPKSAPSFEGNTALNEELVTSDTIGLSGLLGPEDIIFDKQGNLYTGVHNESFTDGKILKIDTSGNSEVFYEAGSWVAGLHFDEKGNLIALSHREGLISISQDKSVTVLAKTDESGRPFLIPNGLDIADNGMIYFSNTSEISPYSTKYGRKIIMEMRPLGGLYQYSPKTGQVKTLINGSYFANGVVVSKDQRYLLMAETTKYRVLKYWLVGEKAGETEIFIDNLPGFPNGISIREDGSYWLGFSTKRNEALDKIHPKVGMKKIVYSLPEFMQPKADPFAMVLNISEQGVVLSSLFDTKGTILKEAGSVKEHNGFLYLGGDLNPYITKYKL